MTDFIEIKTPFDENIVRHLKAGQLIHLSGYIYTGRDAAHKRLCQLITDGKELPVDLDGQAIYFVGPCPAPPGKPIGSAGPTTSYRMDAYSPLVIRETGLKAMIGKGDRSDEVVDAMKKYACVYFAATGGAGALIAKCVKSCENVCYEDLGPEAIYRLELEKLPLIVAIDASGSNLYRR